MIILASGNATILEKWSNALCGSHQISTASNFDALNKMLADTGTVCVALDRKLPGRKLIEAVQDIRKANPATKAEPTSHRCEAHASKPSTSTWANR